MKKILNTDGKMHHVACTVWNSSNHPTAPYYCLCSACDLHTAGVIDYIQRDLSLYIIQNMDEMSMDAIEWFQNYKTYLKKIGGRDDGTNQ